MTQSLPQIVERSFFILCSVSLTSLEFWFFHDFLYSSNYSVAELESFYDFFPHKLAYSHCLKAVSANLLLVNFTSIFKPSQHELMFPTHLLFLAVSCKFNNIMDALQYRLDLIIKMMILQISSCVMDACVWWISQELFAGPTVTESKLNLAMLNNIIFLFMTSH